MSGDAVREACEQFVALWDKVQHNAPAPIRMAVNEMRAALATPQAAPADALTAGEQAMMRRALHGSAERVQLSTARADALREAAKACADIAGKAHTPIAAHAAHDCGDAIRALIPEDK